MNAVAPPAWRPAVTAFVIWFAHFMLCWVAVELWPWRLLANQLAWAVTALALLAMGALAAHLLRTEGGTQASNGAGFHRCLARGAIAIATVALLFTAWPSFVFLSYAR